MVIHDRIVHACSASALHMHARMHALRSASGIRIQSSMIALMMMIIIISIARMMMMVVVPRARGRGRGGGGGASVGNSKTFIFRVQPYGKMQEAGSGGLQPAAPAGEPPPYSSGAVGGSSSPAGQSKAEPGTSS